MLMIPQIPIVAPLIPANAEVFHVDIMFDQHLADFSAGHAGGAIAVDDNIFVRIFRDKRTE